MNETPLPAFALVTLAFVFLTATLRLWLAGRQARAVGAHRAAVPKAFADRIPLAAHQKAADYTRAKLRFSVLGLAVELAFFFALTWGGGLTALHDFWIAYLDGIPYAVALFASVLFLSAVVDLPLSLYRQFQLEARFGFNRMTVKLFFTDQLKLVFVAALLGLPLLAAAFWLIAVSGPHWWFYLWLLWAGFNLLVLFIFPLWIAPLFNRFTPLADGDVKTRVQALLERCRFGKRELFVMDGSRRSSHGNAYFTGFGKARRIVFFDTLLERLQPAEVEAVLAHELGHFHHRHILQRMLMVFGLSLLFCFALGEAFTTAWFFSGLGIAAQNTAMAMALVILILPWYSFPLTPLFSSWSRRHEFQADAYAARMSRADDLADALVKLYEDNAATLTPDPVYSLFYDSHPSAGERVGRLRALGAV